jgi:hypothetical protein
MFISLCQCLEQAAKLEPCFGIDATSLHALLKLIAGLALILCGQVIYE